MDNGNWRTSRFAAKLMAMTTKPTLCEPRLLSAGSKEREFHPSSNNSLLLPSYLPRNIEKSPQQAALHQTIIPFHSNNIPWWSPFCLFSSPSFLSSPFRDLPDTLLSSVLPEQARSVREIYRRVDWCGRAWKHKISSFPCSYRDS